MFNYFYLSNVIEIKECILDNLKPTKPFPLVPAKYLGE